MRLALFDAAGFLGAAGFFEAAGFSGPPPNAFRRRFRPLTIDFEIFFAIAVAGGRAVPFYYNNPAAHKR